MKTKYCKLNDEAIAKLHKHQGLDDWEKDLATNIKYAKGSDESIMLLPVLKNAANKFHDKASKHKANAEKGEREARAKRYDEKIGTNGRYVVIWEALSQPL